MKILIAGSHGMIGTAVTRQLAEHGHEIVRLVHGQPQEGEIHWDPDAGVIDAAALEGFEAVINLATMPWPWRWTAKAKKAMLTNRRATYRLISEALAGCARKPAVMVCASGMGIYPPEAEGIITEDTATCHSFLADVDREGELATAPAEAAGVRVVHLRIPMVLGGARLQQVGFRAGDGRQWMSWVGRDELASIIEFALTNENLRGPVNAVSPNPLRNADFAAVSTAALGLKPGGSMPALFVRLFMGEMGEEFALASRRIQPRRLLESGYRFQYADLADALRHEREVVESGKGGGQAVPA